MVPSPKVRRVVRRFCAEIDTPLSLAAWALFEAGELRQLLDLKINPSSYVDAYSFHLDYQVVAFFKKARWLDVSVDRSKPALEKFRQAEAECGVVNRRFRSRNFTLREEQLLSKIARKIEQTVGFRPPKEWYRHAGWGPGATSSIKGDVATDLKLREPQISVTHRALPYLQHCMAEDLAWMAARLEHDVFGPATPLDCEFAIVDANRVVLVPKTAVIDRVIAAEPTGNIFLQKALGTVIRRKLKRSGIDLNDQTVNQRLAGRAYTQGLCTVDLSHASDSLASEVVFDLLPPEWANLLDALRCKKSVMPDGTIAILEKFSSMGNGFTFELESLIFYAAASAVCDEDEVVSVYGDDIIVPVHRYDALVEVLSLIGFVVNDDKSFRSGNFFESCGRHYFKDEDVTPFYQKERFDESLPEIVRLANRVIRLHDRMFGLHPKNGWVKFRSLFAAIIDKVDLPYGRADNDEAVYYPAFMRRGTTFRFVWRPDRRTCDERVAFSLALRNGTNLESPPFDGTTTVRSRGRWRTAKARKDVS